MTKAEKYVNEFLLPELGEINSSEIKDDAKVLDVYEKTIIYKYTNDGYEDLNRKLRLSNGNNDTDFGKLLDKAILKLPDYIGLVYRGVYLNNVQVEKYRLALKNNLTISESTFISTSKSIIIAKGFGNVLFRIVSKSGKSIEKISKFGFHKPPSEQEIIFRPNRKFKVLEINDSVITLEEI